MEENYSYFRTHGGGDYLDSASDMGDGLYYTIIGLGQYNGEYGVEINFHYQVDINKKPLFS